MQIKVRFFASLKNLVGKGSEEREMPAGSSVHDLWKELLRDYPALASYQGRLGFAVNAEYASLDQTLRQGDEVALLPPVSGGAPPSHGLLLLTEDPLDEQAISESVRAPECGVVLTFVGVVRDHTGERQVIALDYEAYPEMALTQLEGIRAEIGERWPRVRVALAHRTGRLQVGEASVVVAVASPHRAEAFEACCHAIERIKQVVPIWKKEIGGEGEEGVEGKAAPHQAW